MATNETKLAARAQLTHAVVEVVTRTAGDLRLDPPGFARLPPNENPLDGPPADAHPAESVDELRSELEGLRIAMQSRAVIEQAKGMLMLRHHCDEHAAFLILVRASQQMQLKLRDVAQHVVEWGSGYGPEAPSTR